MTKYMDIVQKDIEGLKLSDAQYGGSWLRRGGVGAFMMLARKWDRIEQKFLKDPEHSLIGLIKNDTRAEGIIDDIRDLRRYLMLVQAYYIGGEDYVKYLDEVANDKIPAELVGSVVFTDLKSVWDELEKSCKECGWDIFDIDSIGEANSYDIKQLRMLLVQLEVNFNDIGINPTHRDNA